MGNTPPKQPKKAKAKCPTCGVPLEDHTLTEIQECQARKN